MHTHTHTSPHIHTLVLTRNKPTKHILHQFYSPSNTHAHAYTHVYTHAYTHVHTHVYTHAYTHVYTHAHTHTCAPRPGLSRGSGVSMEANWLIRVGEMKRDTVCDVKPPPHRSR